MRHESKMMMGVVGMVMVVALGLVGAAEGAVLESRQDSWDYDATNWTHDSTQSYVGRTVGGTYLAGMWSAAVMDYTLDDPASTGSPTDFDDLSDIALTYNATGYDAPGFSDRVGTWNAPKMFRNTLQHFTNWMGGNDWGGAEVFNNVIPDWKNMGIELTISGSMRFIRHTFGDKSWCDTWILKKDLAGAYTVLWEDHQQRSQDDWHVTFNFASSPIMTTLLPGEQIFVMEGGRSTTPFGIRHQLETGNLVWDVRVIPEPATMGLLGIGGLLALRRRVKKNAETQKR